MTTQQDKYTYEPFAQTAEYLTVNAAIVRGWVDVMMQRGNKQVERLLDVATGVGTMLELFAENAPKQWDNLSAVCVDMSAEALKQASARLSRVVSDLELIHSKAEEMNLPEKSVDVVVWGNGIHYLDPKGQEQALAAIKRALKPGGWFCFNSAFYAESRPPETLPFYLLQVRKAVSYLRSMGIQRQEREARVEASNFLPRSHYEELLKRLGFTVEEVREVPVRIYKTAWEQISSFHQYAAGALHGYNPDAAVEAMRQAVGPALEAHGQKDENNNLYIQRNWLSVIARPSSPSTPQAQPAG